MSLFDLCDYCNTPLKDYPLFTGFYKACPYCEHAGRTSGGKEIQQTAGQSTPVSFEVVEVYDQPKSFDYKIKMTGAGGGGGSAPQPSKASIHTMCTVGYEPCHFGDGKNGHRDNRMANHFWPTVMSSQCECGAYKGSSVNPVPAWKP